MFSDRYYKEMSNFRTLKIVKRQILWIEGVLQKPAY
jgi:hypothetical protein